MQATFQPNEKLQLADIVFTWLIFINRLRTLVIFQCSLHQLNSVNRLLTGREAATLG